MSDQIFLTGIAGFGYHGLFDHTTEPVNLIEKLAGRIADQILKDHSKVLVATVTVHKPQAPVDAVLKDIAVQVTRKR